MPPYIIFDANNLTALANEVAKLVRDGYIPLGGPFSTVEPVEHEPYYTNNATTVGSDFDKKYPSLAAPIMRTVWHQALWRKENN